MVCGNELGGRCLGLAGIPMLADAATVPWRSPSVAPGPPAFWKVSKLVERVIAGNHRVKRHHHRVFFARRARLVVVELPAAAVPAVRHVRDPSATMDNAARREYGDVSRIRKRPFGRC